MNAFHRAPAIAGSSDAPTREQVLEALSGVLDPELGMSVGELGLIYGIERRSREQCPPARAAAASGIRQPDAPEPVSGGRPACRAPDRGSRGGPGDRL